MFWNFVSCHLNGLRFFGCLLDELYIIHGRHVVVSVADLMLVCDEMIALSRSRNLDAVIMGSMPTVRHANSCTVFSPEVVSCLVCLRWMIGRFFLGTSNFKGFDKVSIDDFLLSYNFGVKLRQTNSSKICESRNRCRECVDYLVENILSQHVISSDFFQRLYCLFLELLLEVDDCFIFQLFSRLLRVLERSAFWAESEARASVDEFTTFVVDARSCHHESGESAEKIEDAVSYLLSDYSCMSRRNLSRIMKS